MSNLVAARLRACESVIEAGQQTFIEVGQALGRIRDERLFRETGFHSFEAYCQERWSMNRDYANKLIRGAKVDTNVSTSPANEAQARALAQVPTRKREAVMAEVVERAETEGQRVSARLIEEVALGAPRGSKCSHCEVHCPDRYVREAQR